MAIETPERLAGALPLAVAEVTVKLVASCVVLLRSRVIVCPPGTVKVAGVGTTEASVPVELNVRFQVPSGPEL